MTKIYAGQRSIFEKAANKKMTLEKSGGHL